MVKTARHTDAFLVAEHLEQSIVGSRLTEFIGSAVKKRGNFFRAIDYVIDMAEAPLTEDIIKELHRILKQSTKDTTLAWFAVGDYKKRGLLSLYVEHSHQFFECVLSVKAGIRQAACRRRL